MSVCTTCLQPGIRDYSKHDCPGLGEIQLTRKLGHGLIVQTAPRRARMDLAVLVDAKWGAVLQDNNLVNIADQVLYQVTGYDPESASLLLELVEDWRLNPRSGTMTDGTCTAILKTPEGLTRRCTQPAGHYDGDNQPDPLADDEPGGWHRSTPGADGDRATWADWASNATPHKASRPEQDDPPVRCWHTEPGSPCDWNVCRQPERLAAGDRGTDPARATPHEEPSGA